MFGRSKIVLLLLAFAGFLSCSKEKDYPVIPELQYEGFEEEANNSGYLTFSFTDGDGDIGLGSADTLPPYNPGSQYYYNIYLPVLKVEHDSVKPLLILNSQTQQYDTAYLSYRIKPIDAVSSNGSLKGKMIVNIDLSIIKPFLPNDSIAFDAYIFDRNLHKSNIIRTPVIKL